MRPRKQPTAGSKAARDLLGAARDLPGFWLALLERARAQGDYTACAEADRELRRLGLRITFPLRQVRQEALDATS